VEALAILGAITFGTIVLAVVMARSAGKSDADAAHDRAAREESEDMRKAFEDAAREWDGKGPLDG
jgi:hypothetical protein